MRLCQNLALMERTFMISNEMNKSDPDSGQGASGDPEAAKKARFAMQRVIGPGRTCAPEISSSNSMHLSWANQATRVPKRKSLVDQVKCTCHLSCLQAAEIQKQLNAASLASGGNVMESDMVKCRTSQMILVYGCWLGLVAMCDSLCLPQNSKVLTVAEPSTKRPT